MNAAMEKKQEDLQFLGTFGIFKESFNLIFRWRKLFVKITLALLLPLSCLSLAYYGISTFLSGKMVIDNTLSTINNIQQIDYTNFSDSISPKWTVYWLLVNAAYLVLSLILSLFSISAVVCTVAYAYTDREPTFKGVVRVVPKVWKQLVITFLCEFGVIFAYTFVFVVVTLLLAGIMVACISYKSDGGRVGLAILLMICAVLYLVGLIYLSIVWQLANVVSVMEKICGIHAMSKSKALMKGKMGASIGVYFLLALCSLPNYLLIKQLQGLDWKSICCGILVLVLLTFVYLINLVVQTVLYFVCKSYHHEIVDKSSLANHLEAHLGEYFPLDTNDSQQQYHHV